MSLPSLQCKTCGVWHVAHGATTRGDVITLDEHGVCPECAADTDESKRRIAKGYQRAPEGTVAGGAKQHTARAEERDRRLAPWHRDQLIAEARAARDAGEPVAVLAERYGVSRSTIRRWTG